MEVQSLLLQSPLPSPASRGMCTTDDAEVDAAAEDEAAAGGGPTTAGSAWTGAVSVMEDRAPKRLRLHLQKLLLLVAAVLCTL